MRRALSALLLLLAAGCASLPGREAANTPAEGVVRDSYAAVVIGAPPLFGGLGSSVAIDDRHVITNAHVLRVAGLTVNEATLVRDDGARAPARLVARSPRMDLAVLRMPEGFLAPARFGPRTPDRHEPVWAAGTTALGPGLALGKVIARETELAGFGEGFTARLGALMGYSGGPVVGRDGRVLGLTTALVNPGSAPVLAALTGTDLQGLLAKDGRDIFVLGIGPALAEARRLIAESDGRDRP
ncbi:MAG: serine protease [Elioraea sp.]|nr:serine protease [Elioraea sp.]